MTCRHCGRAADRSDQRYCGDCGARLHSDSGTSSRGAFSSGTNLRDRIGAVYSHADWRMLRDHTPSSSGPTTGMSVVASIALVMTLGAAAIAVLAWRRFDPPQTWQWGLIGGAALLSILALAWALRSLSRLTAFLGAEVERVPVAVVGERRKVTTTRNGAQGRPTHFVTLEREDRAAFEVQCTPRVASRVNEQDVAVAYLRGGVLLDLIPVA